MSEEIWLTCLTHALSTETEEIMGLLLGDIQVCPAIISLLFPFIWIQLSHFIMGFLVAFFIGVALGKFVEDFTGFWI